MSKDNNNNLPEDDLDNEQTHESTDSDEEQQVTNPAVIHNNPAPINFNAAPAANPNVNGDNLAIGNNPANLNLGFPGNAANAAVDLVGNNAGGLINPNVGVINFAGNNGQPIGNVHIIPVNTNVGNIAFPNPEVRISIGGAFNVGSVTIGDTTYTPITHSTLGISENVAFVINESLKKTGNITSSNSLINNIDTTSYVIINFTEHGKPTNKVTETVTITIIPGQVLSVNSALVEKVAQYNNKFDLIVPQLSSVKVGDENGKQCILHNNGEGMVIESINLGSVLNACTFDLEKITLTEARSKGFLQAYSMLKKCLVLGIKEEDGNVIEKLSDFVAGHLFEIILVCQKPTKAILPSEIFKKIAEFLDATDIINYLKNEPPLLASTATVEEVEDSILPITVAEDTSIRDDINNYEVNYTGGSSDDESII